MSACPARDRQAWSRACDSNGSIPAPKVPGWPGAHLGQQHLDQVVIDAGACLLGRFGDRHPQLPPGHRGDQVPVLDRAGQLRVVRAPGLEVGAHAQHDQRRWCLIWAVPGGGGRVQGGDERLPLPLIGALGEQLLELVDHQQQPPRPRRLVALSRGAVGIPGRPGWPRQGGLPRGEGEPLRIEASSPRRTADASVPASTATRSASSSSGARVGVNTTHGHDAAPGAAASPAARIRGSTPARSNDDLPAPDTPDTISSPAPASVP